MQSTVLLADSDSHRAETFQALLNFLDWKVERLDYRKAISCPETSLGSAALFLGQLESGSVLAKLLTRIRQCLIPPY